MTDKYANLRARLAALRLAGPVSTDARAWNAATDALDVELVAELLAERDAMVQAFPAISCDHEKRIREALSDPTQGHQSAIVAKADLRALLADLDAMRGALKRIACIQNKMFGDDWEEIEDAREIARAALKGAAHECR